MRVSALAGAARSDWSSGRTRPVAEVAGGSAPASPSCEMVARLIASLMAWRTARLAVGPLARLGTSVTVFCGANQYLLCAGSLET